MTPDGLTSSTNIFTPKPTATCRRRVYSPPPKSDGCCHSPDGTSYAPLASMPYGTTRSPPNAAISAAARAISPASQVAGSGCNATVPSPAMSSITQYPTLIELLADGGMLHSDPYWAPMNAKGPPLPPAPVPGHDSIVGDGATSPPNPLRAVPAAPWANRPAGGEAASLEGVEPLPPKDSSARTARAITAVIGSRKPDRRCWPARSRRLARLCAAGCRSLRMLSPPAVVVVRQWARATGS